MPSRIQSYFSYLYAKRLVKTRGVLKRIRSNDGVPKMLEKSAIKELLYGGISEILNNRQYYYHSSIGAEYSHFTDAGKAAMAEYLNIMGAEMIKAEEASLNKRAKDLVINGLKGEKV
jgi:DNA-binding GntR family transcriptional regulator